MNALLTKAARLRDLAARIGMALEWLPPSVARLAVGLIFFQSGWGKLHNLDQVTDYFAELGLPAPSFQALLASSTELVCGALLLLGLATRLAAIPLIIVMIVALRTALWEQIDSLGSLFGMAEFLYIALLLYLGTAGAGPLSMDGLVARLRTRSVPDTHALTSRPVKVAA